LKEALDGIEDLESHCIFVDPEDYQRYRVPRWARLSGPWEISWIARRKVREAALGHYDFLMVNCWEFVVVFQSLARRVPTVASMDSVPSMFDTQIKRASNPRGLSALRRTCTHLVHNRAFSTAVGSIDFFLPQSGDCARALQEDYAVRRERCFVTLAPQDLDLWKPASRERPGLLRLLFVGNDFTRKGGGFLLRLMAEHLHPACTLTIVSNDPALSGQALPDGVQLVTGRNRDQLLEVYQSSDVFVFPTRRDFIPQVLCEALAVGLPCVATDVGAIRELVQDNENGYLMPYDAGIDDWAVRIKHLVEKPDLVDRMSRNARGFAEERLGLARYQRLIHEVVGMLRSSPPGKITGGITL
jgi:glycosyltransferase involved in cell wall biosynthesis